MRSLLVGIVFGVSSLAGAAHAAVTMINDRYETWVYIRADGSYGYEDSGDRIYVDGMEKYWNASLADQRKYEDSFKAFVAKEAKVPGVSEAYVVKPGLSYHENISRLHEGKIDLSTTGVPSGRIDDYLSHLGGTAMIDRQAGTMEVSNTPPTPKQREIMVRYGVRSSGNFRVCTDLPILGHNADGGPDRNGCLFWNRLDVHDRRGDIWRVTLRIPKGPK